MVHLLSAHACSRNSVFSTAGSSPSPSLPTAPLSSGMRSLHASIRVLRATQYFRQSHPPHHISHIAKSHITRLTPHVTRHTSHATRHIYQSLPLITAHVPITRMQFHCPAAAAFPKRTRYGSQVSDVCSAHVDSAVVALCLVCTVRHAPRPTHCSFTAQPTKRQDHHFLPQLTSISPLCQARLRMT